MALTQPLLDGAFFGIDLPVETNTSVKPVTGLKADVPQSSVDVSVPYVIGRRRVSKPNVIWYGNLKAQYETTTETTSRQYKEMVPWILGAKQTLNTIEEVTITTETPVGFLTDIMAGICLGPDVVLKEIYSDGELIWAGTAGPGRTTFTIGANDTAFSGCQVAFAGGAFNQGVDPWIDQEDFPAHVGVAYIVIREMKADTRLGALSFEVERFPNPLGLTTAENRLDDDINLATAMYDVIQNQWGGAGVSGDYLSADSFEAAAVVFEAEANYCSVLVDTETAVKAVISSLQAQGYALIYQNPATGKLEIKPIRESSLNYATVPKFGRKNIVAVQSFQKQSWADTIEILRGVYVERTNNYEPTPVPVQNIGNVSQTLRAKRSRRTEYPYCTKADLCLFLTSRDLAISSVPVYSMGLVVNRDGAELLPGTVVLVDEPDYGFYGVPMTVLKVREGAMDDNTVILTLIQYTLPNRSPIFDVPGTPIDSGVNFDPTAPTSATFISAPYWVAERAGLIDGEDTTNVVFPMIFAIPANAIQGKFKAYMSNFPDIGKTEITGNSPYPTYGQLNQSISKFEGWTTGVIPSVVIDAVINPVLLTAYNSDAMRKGHALMFIGNEIFAFESAANVGPNQWELTNVRRALVDTVAIDHAVGARVFVVNNLYLNVGSAFAYPLTFAPNWRLTSSTINEDGKYENALNINGWSPTVPRTLRPVRPHDTMIEGVRSSTPVTVLPDGEYDITWKTRRRSHPTIAFQVDAALDSEPTGSGTVVRHRAYLRANNGTLWNLGETDEDANYNTLSVTIPAGAAAGEGTLFIRAVNEYGESLYDDTLPVTVWKGSTVTLRYALET